MKERPAWLLTIEELDAVENSLKGGLVGKVMALAEKHNDAAAIVMAQLYIDRVCAAQHEKSKRYLEAA